MVAYQQPSLLGCIVDLDPVSWILTVYGGCAIIIFPGVQNNITGTPMQTFKCPHCSQVHLYCYTADLNASCVHLKAVRSMATLTPQQRRKKEEEEEEVLYGDYNGRMQPLSRMYFSLDSRCLVADHPASVQEEVESHFCPHCNSLWHGPEAQSNQNR